MSKKSQTNEQFKKQLDDAAMIAVNWLVAVLEPTVDEKRDPSDTSPPRENENRGFHILFDAYVGKSHNSVATSKDYFDRAQLSYMTRRENDPTDDDMDTIKAHWATLRAEKQLDAAIAIRDFMDSAYQQLTGQCFDLQAWKDSLPYNNSGTKAKASQSAKQELASAISAYKNRSASR